MQNLKRIITFFIVLYSVFILLNLLEAIWHTIFSFGNEKLYFFIHIKNYEGKFHFWMNVLEYLLHFVFLLVANHFVKKHNLGKGYHILIVLLAFLPIANYFLLYMIWRKLNKQLFNYSGVDWLKSDRKIKTIWIMTLISILYLILSLLLTSYLYYSMPISEVGHYLEFLKVIGKIYYLVISILYLFYYLELKRVIGKAEPGMNNLNYTSLLDN